MRLVPILSTIIYVATFFTMFLAVFSYTGFQLRAGQRNRKLKSGIAAAPARRQNRLLRVWLIDQVQLIGTLKWFDPLGIRMRLLDGREITVCDQAIIYYEEVKHNRVLMPENPDKLAPSMAKVV